MSDEIEQEIATTVVDLLKAGRDAPREAWINPRDFRRMVDRLNAKVHPPVDGKPEHVILYIVNREVRVEPDAEVPLGHVDITSDALKETP